MLIMTYWKRRKNYLRRWKSAHALSPVGRGAKAEAFHKDTEKQDVPIPRKQLTEINEFFQTTLFASLPGRVACDVAPHPVRTARSVQTSQMLNVERNVQATQCPQFWNGHTQIPRHDLCTQPIKICSWSVAWYPRGPPSHTSAQESRLSAPKSVREWPPATGEIHDRLKDLFHNARHGTPPSFTNALLENVRDPMEDVLHDLWCKKIDLGLPWAM